MSIKKREIKWYGWQKDNPDFRDFTFSAPMKIVANLPSAVDLRPLFPPVLNQSSLGACTAFAIANAHLFGQLKQKAKDPFLPSRLFIYYNERVIEGTVNEDSGAMLRDGLKTVGKQGVCDSKHWPYNIKNFAIKPPANCYTQGLKNTAVKYSRVLQCQTQMKACLADGYPFVLGFAVYESFESEAVAKTGIVPMPSKRESALGGHAVICAGYNDATRRFLIQNSWGANWGMNGYFTIPYEYLINPNLAADFWTIRLVKDE